MDPLVDTYDEAPLSPQPNAVAPTTAEADAFGTALAPELFPDAAADEPAAANAIPGESAADVVRNAGDEPERADTLPDPEPQPAAIPGDAPPQGDDMLLGELPVPPPQFHDAHGQGQGQDPEDEDENMGDDLFGDDDDDDDDLGAGGDAPAAEEQPDDGLTPEERARRRALEYDEEEITGEMAADREEMFNQEQQVTADVPLANVPVPAGGKVWHARMPNFLEIRTKPFDDKSWDPKEEDMENVGADEAAASAAGGAEVKQRMVPDENVIRWRWTKDQLGEAVKQSNARIVRWSDGTLSLQLGAELFDMTLTLDHSALLSSTNHASAPAPPAVNSVTAGLTASSFDTSRGHGLTYLTARHPWSESLLEAHASVHGGIAFRPATLASQTHKRLAGMVAQRQAAAKGRSTKSAAFPEMDPELQRQMKERKRNEAAKKAKREAAKAAGRGGRSGARRTGAKKATRLEGLSDDEGSGDDYDEDAEGEEDDDEAYGGSASQSRRSQPRMGRGGPLAARDYSDDDDDGFLAKSDEEMEASDGAEDEIEAADAAAERQARRRKERARRPEGDGAASQGGAAAMDAEEEEEDASQAAPRRRMVVESDEE